VNLCSSNELRFGDHQLAQSEIFQLHERLNALDWWFEVRICKRNNITKKQQTMIVLRKEMSCSWQSNSKFRGKSELSSFAITGAWKTTRGKWVIISKGNKDRSYLESFLEEMGLWSDRHTVWTWQDWTLGIEHAAKAGPRETTMER
jgi:hypothetical protein